MDDHSEKSQENGCAEFSHSSDELLGFDPSSNSKSRSLLYVLRCLLLRLLLHGADNVVKDRRAVKARLDLANGLVSDSSRVLNPKTTRVSEGIEFEDRKTEEFRSSKSETVFSKSGNPNNFHCSSKFESDNIHFPMNFLAFLVVLMAKIAGFQISLFLSLLTFPIWSSYFLFMSLLFPFQTIKRVKGYLAKKVLRVWSVTLMTVTSSVSKRAKAQKSKAVRLGWAFISSIYACFMLLGLLALGFLLGGFMMQRLIEKPIQVRESLEFDYGKSSPVAFAPLKDITVGRVFPPNHKLHVAVSLTVPESEYNQKLGVFQVRVDFLSANGNAIATSVHPCMLRFKSPTIRSVETFLKTIPLLAGFQSESQTLIIKTADFTEGTEPTAGLRVVLEHRAGSRETSEGIPQVYGASLLIASELPKLKRFIWGWRRTMFVWCSVTSFLAMLIFILAFFRPFLLPNSPIRVGHLGKNDNVLLLKLLPCGGN